MEAEHGAFEVPDFWRKSAFTLSHAPEQTLFSDTQFELPLIDHDAAIDLHLPELDTFRFGQLEEISAPEDVSQEQSVSHNHPSEPSASGEIEALWKLDTAQPQDTSLRTWEAFTNGVHDEERVSCISEAGPQVFDALQPQDTDVLQSAFTLKCLGLLGLGRSSALFQWDEEDSKFMPTLDNVRLSGLSRTAFESTVDRLSHVGLAFARLRQFVQVSYADRRPLAARVALATSVQAVLEALDQRLADHVLDAPSTLQLLGYLEAPGRLLAEVQDIVICTAAATTDADFLKMVHERVEQLGHSCSPYHNLHTEILDRVSRPWFLETCRSTGLLHKHLDLSDSDKALEPANHLSAQDAERIMEIVTGLATLNGAAPEHPLLCPASWGVAQPDLDFSVTGVNVNRIIQKANAYQNDLLSAIRKYGNSESKPRQAKTSGQSQDVVFEQLPWDLDQGQQEYFELVGNQFSQLPEPASDVSDLQAITTAMIGTKYEEGSGSLDIMLSQKQGATSLLRLQPYIDVQHRLVNGSTLRIMFRQFSLRKHLELNHSFHLLGNGVFVHRLTNALFSSASSSTERSRGKVPNTINLGLRLDNRSSQKWPPASSELRLGLMGVLSDAWGEKDLPGGMSFAIRELSDEDIEKVLDPHGIHALDFLRLSYEAPPPLDIVFTEAAMVKYDDCFRILLGVLRMLHVSTLLRVAAAERDSSEALRAFAHESQHCISALASYFFDCGVTVPWRVLTSRLDTIEANLAAEDAGNEAYGSRVTISIQGLRNLLDETLDAIRARLFLRSRHTRLREGVEAIFGTVLQVQKLCVESEGRPSDAAIWKLKRDLKLQAHDLMDGLRDLVRKLGKKREMGGQDRDDALAAEMLVLKLGGGA